MSNNRYSPLVVIIYDTHRGPHSAPREWPRRLRAVPGPLPPQPLPRAQGRTPGRARGQFTFVSNNRFREESSQNILRLAI